MKLKFILLLVVTFSANILSQDSIDNSIAGVKPRADGRFYSLDGTKSMSAKEFKEDTEKRMQSVLEAKNKAAKDDLKYRTSVFGTRGNTFSSVGEVHEQPKQNRDNWERILSDVQQPNQYFGLILAIVVVLFFYIVTRKKSAQPLKNYNEKDYNVIKEKLSEMYSDNLLTKEELEIKLADLEEKQKREKKEVELNLRKEKLYKAYKEGIITLQEYNSKLSSL